MIKITLFELCINPNKKIKLLGKKHTYWELKTARVKTWHRPADLDIRYNVIPKVYSHLLNVIIVTYQGDVCTYFNAFGRVTPATTMNYYQEAKQKHDKNYTI